MTIARTYFRVYLKATWDAEWTVRNDISPLKVNLAAAPTLGSGQFRIEYGSGVYEDLSALADASAMASYTRWYVQVTASDTDDFDTETVWWTGVIPAQKFKLLGQAGSVKSADVTCQAYAIDHLLDTRLDTAYVRAVGDPTGAAGWTAKLIDNLPSFNVRAEGGGIAGNRTSVIKTSLETHAFSDEGYVWSNYDIVEYLLKHNQAIGTGVSPPEFVLNCRAEIKTALEGMQGVYDFNGQTLRQALNRLMNRARGISWKAHVDLDDDLWIVPFSILDTDLTVGSVTIPEHDTGDRQTPDKWTSPQAQVDIVCDDSRRFDKIIVRGGRIKVCATWAMVDGTLVKGWSDDEETAYHEAAKNTAGYDALTTDEKAKLNDRHRRTDRFDKVYAHYRVPADWNWIINPDPDPPYDGYFANPDFSPYTGEFADPMENGPYWNVRKQFMGYLPFKVGIDYSADPHVDNNPANTAPELRRPFAVIMDADSSYRYAERFEPHRAAVRTLNTEMGIDVRFSHPHLLGANHFNTASPAPEPTAIEDLVANGADYDTLQVTAMVATDQWLQLFGILSGTFDSQRVITINIPEAQLWYIVPETVVDIDADGSLIKYEDGTGTPTLIRDDRAILESVLAAATAWYGKKRNRITITLQELNMWTWIGNMLEGVDITGSGDSAGVVVTSIEIDFTARTTTVRTDYEELDIKAIAGFTGGAVPALPNLQVAAKKIAALTDETEQIKSEINKNPQRVEPDSGSTATQWAIVTQMPEYDTATKEKFVVQKASVSGGAWTGDGVDIEISRCLGFEGLGADGKDVRNFSPWPKTNCIVRLIKQWIGAISNDTGVTYTHATKTFNKTGIGSGVSVGEPVKVSGSNLTASQYVVTEVPDNDSIVCADMTSTGDNTDSVVDVGGANFWFLDEPLTWGGAAADASMRANETDGYQMAVWK